MVFFILVVWFYSADKPPEVTSLRAPNAEQCQEAILPTLTKVENDVHVRYALAYCAVPGTKS